MILAITEDFDYQIENKKNRKRIKDDGFRVDSMELIPLGLRERKTLTSHSRHFVRKFWCSIVWKRLCQTKMNKSLTLD